MRELGGAPEMSFAEVLTHIGPCDLVLVEGYKRESFPKVEIRREGAASREPLHGKFPQVVAIASDRPEMEGGALPTFFIDDIKSIADFVVSHLGLKQP
jgi:molybdopterin-guanine dinucleotide biosynthesis protein B